MSYGLHPHLWLNNIDCCLPNFVDVMISIVGLSLCGGYVGQQPFFLGPNNFDCRAFFLDIVTIMILPNTYGLLLSKYFSIINIFAVVGRYYILYK